MKYRRWKNSVRVEIILENSVTHGKNVQFMWKLAKFWILSEITFNTFLRDQIALCAIAAVLHNSVRCCYYYIDSYIAMQCFPIM